MLNISLFIEDIDRLPLKMDIRTFKKINMLRTINSYSILSQVLLIVNKKKTGTFHILFRYELLKSIITTLLSTPGRSAQIMGQAWPVDCTDTVLDQNYITAILKESFHKTRNFRRGGQLSGSIPVCNTTGW